MASGKKLRLLDSLRLVESSEALTLKNKFEQAKAIYQTEHERRCFIGISKHREESWKYNVQQSILAEIGGVWIADETLPRVFDTSSQSKQKLSGKRRSEIVKIYAN